MMYLNRKKWCLDTLKNLHIHRLDNKLILSMFLYPLSTILCGSIFYSTFKNQVLPKALPALECGPSEQCCGLV